MRKRRKSVAHAQAYVRRCAMFVLNKRCAFEWVAAAAAKKFKFLHFFFLSARNEMKRRFIFRTKDEVYHVKNFNFFVQGLLTLIQRVFYIHAVVSLFLI